MSTPDELITFLQYTELLSKTYKNDKDEELVRWVNKWSANNKMDEETSVEKWRRENNDDTKSTPGDIFNKSKNKMRENTIKAQKYLDKIEHGIEEEEEAENTEEEEAENEEEEKEETEQLEEKHDDDEEEKDKNEGIEKVLINVQLTEVNDNTATGRNTNLSVLKKYDFIDFNELICNLCLMKLDINCVMHKNSNNFLCSTCMAAAASVHQSTPATIHYPIQNHNGGPIIKDFTKHYTTMQDKIEEAMNNTEGGTMKNDEGGNITSITIEKSGYKRKLNEPAADLISAEGTIPFPNQQYSRDDNELSINNAGDRLQSFTTKPRGNLTYCGITYNCNKHVKDKFTDNFMQYFSCTNVYHEKEGIWKKGRNTKDKVDEGKIKCDA